MRAQLTGLAVLLLAACGGGEKSDTPNTSAPKGPALDETQRRIVAMGESERNAILIQAIRGAHQDCQHVDSSEAVENAGGTPSYVATCDRTKHYAVTIGPNGAGAVTTVDQPGR